MKDPRAIICGALAAVALICATVLSFPPDRDTGIVMQLLALAGTFGGFVVGLFSTPKD